MRASMVLGECRSSCLNSYSGEKVEKDVPLALFLTVPSGKTPPAEKTPLSRYSRKR